jgi:hypothetical protein
MYDVSHVQGDLLRWEYHNFIFFEHLCQSDKMAEGDMLERTHVLEHSKFVHSP